MKIYSITTDEIAFGGQRTAYNKTIYGKGEKPQVPVGENPHSFMSKKIFESFAQVTPDIEFFMVTIKTTKGTFVKTYAVGAPLETFA